MTAEARGDGLDLIDSFALRDIADDIHAMRLQQEAAQSAARWQALRAEAARLGHIVDNSGWNAKLVPIAEYARQQEIKKAVQERKAACRWPIEVKLLSAKLRAKN
jgi:hypothetical protein